MLYTFIKPNLLRFEKNMNIALKKVVLEKLMATDDELL